MDKKKTMPKETFFRLAAFLGMSYKQLAESSGADYLGVGAVFPSPTKKDAIRITPEQFRDIAGSVRIPAVAIGGITKENITDLQGLGAAGAAVVSAVFGAADIEHAAAEMKRLAGGIV